jgi:ATP-dependent protease HslVU (ClpYQ) ATPase subunit
MLEDRKVEVAVEQKAVPMMFTGIGMEANGPRPPLDVRKNPPKSSSRREMTVAEAREFLFEQEFDALINRDKVNAAAIDLAERTWESSSSTSSTRCRGERVAPRADVSRPGVHAISCRSSRGPRSRTPLRQGSRPTISSSLRPGIPPLQAERSDARTQGRFPIRVELNA